MIVQILTAAGILVLVIIATRIYGHIACIHDRMMVELTYLNKRTKRHSDFVRNCLANCSDEKLQEQFRILDEMNGHDNGHDNDTSPEEVFIKIWFPEVVAVFLQNRTF